MEIWSDPFGVPVVEVVAPRAAVEGWGCSMALFLGQRST